MTVSNTKGRFTRSAPLIILSGLVLLATLAVFSQVLKADFVMWDDDVIICLNRNLGPLSWARIRWAFTDVSSMMRYNPLSLISWCGTLSLFGMNPFGFHLGNLLLHSFSSVILFFVLRKILSHAASFADNRLTEDRWRISSAAFLATLCWAVHPLRVEPVAWATDRTYCQAFFFIMLSTLGYLIANENGITSRKRSCAMVLSFVCYALSLLSYANGITFFLALFVMDIFLFRRIGGEKGWWSSQSARQVLLEKFVFACPALFVSVISVAVRTKSAGIWGPPVPLSEFGMLSRFMQACYMVAHFVYRPLYPFDLAPVYSTLVSFDPLSVPFVLRAFSVFAALSAAIFFRRRFPVVLAVLLTYCLLMIPVMGFFEHPHYPSDRYSLLPVVPFSVLIGWLLLKIKGKAAYAIISSAAIVLIAYLGVLSFDQTRTWHDSETLFTHMLETLGTDPYREDIDWRMGKFLYYKGETERATKYFEDAVSINPESPVAGYFLRRIKREQADRSVAGKTGSL